MIGLDTNIIIRYLTQDDPEQSIIASELIENKLDSQNPGFISLIVLIEVVWVLKISYQQNKADLSNVIESLLTTKQLMIEKPASAYKALRYWQNGNGDFSDALTAVISKENGCQNTLTFDKKATSVGMMSVKER
ncbi:MAG: type II toxin-antitoxin system VapC family toxin [Gammaproteobacteria bacterium]|nr:type II toxin-antitoxin system VapC family toxin [Gammaproteobacteria bacterium]